jgi:hypothetical protein
MTLWSGCSSIAMSSGCCYKTMTSRSRTRPTFASDDVAAGRRYVEAYVPYVHYVEGLWEVATKPAKGHYPESAAHAH